MGRRRSPAALSSRVGGSKTPVVAILRFNQRHKRPKRKAHYQSAASWINQRACWGPRLASVGRCYFKQAFAILCVCCRFSASSFTNASVWRQWACVDRSLYINVYRGMLCGWGWGRGGSLLLLFILQDLVYCALSKCQRCQSNPPIKPNPCCWALPVFISADRRAQSPHAPLHPPTHPFTHPSLNTPSHSPSLLCSLSLIDRFTPHCDIFYAIADASWFVWHAYLHPPVTHRQMLCSSICACVCVFWILCCILIWKPLLKY